MRSTRLEGSEVLKVEFIYEMELSGEGLREILLMDREGLLRDSDLEVSCVSFRTRPVQRIWKCTLKRKSKTGSTSTQSPKTQSPRARVRPPSVTI